jgi:hypothetical protein
MTNCRILSSLVGLLLFITSTVNAAEPALLQVTVVPVGVITNVSKPQGASGTGSYLFWLACVTDEHGQGVIGLGPHNFTALTTFIGEIQSPDQARAISLNQLKIEDIPASAIGCYLLQISSPGPAPLPASHPARAILKVTKERLLVPLPGGPPVPAEVIATGQVAF